MISDFNDAFNFFGNDEIISRDIYYLLPAFKYYT
jgi:hypothetical protein